MKAFEELSRDELYELLALRTDIFVVEQDCPYPELDFKDQHSLHVLGYQYDHLVACARIVLPLIEGDLFSIGRLAVRQNFRGLGYARHLFARCLQHCRDTWPGAGITVMAQIYLEDFYAGFGFETFTDPYEEDGITHVDMLLK